MHTKSSFHFFHLRPDPLCCCLNVFRLCENISNTQKKKNQKAPKRDCRCSLSSHSREMSFTTKKNASHTNQKASLSKRNQIRTGLLLVWLLTDRVYFPSSLKVNSIKLQGQTQVIRALTIFWFSWKNTDKLSI